MKIFKLFFVILLWLIMKDGLSQGCNDAGLCTTGDFGSITTGPDGRYLTQISYTFGLGEEQAIIQTFQLDQSIYFLEGKLQFLFRIPFSYIHGNLGNTAGIGDITLGLNSVFYRNGSLKFSLLLAGKLPSNDANFSRKGKSLPMVYQTSLGTYDALGGINMQYREWIWGLGFQYSFGSNDNGFSHAIWRGDERALEYWESNELKRGPDLVLRLDKKFGLLNDNELRPGLVGIYRLTNDQIKENDRYIEVIDSDGLTLNAALAYDIYYENQSSIRIMAAAPLITRKARPDGLTRTFVVSFIYTLGMSKVKIIKPFVFPEKTEN